MLSFPNAKINIGLFVTEKLPNGYHAIETIMYPIPLYDALEIMPTKDKTVFEQSGIAIDTEPENNLVYRAYKLLRKKFDLPDVNIHLLKKIPFGAGLGGGSADASFAITALNQLFSLKLSVPEMEQLSADIGSDCAFFIRNQPAIAKGVGNKLTKIALNELNDKFLVLVKSEVHISTADAYSRIQPRQTSFDLNKLPELKISEWRKYISNDFEMELIPQHPILGEIKDELYKSGALFASMSGSGSTIYGIFEKKVDLSDLFKSHFCKTLKI